MNIPKLFSNQPNSKPQPQVDFLTIVLSSSRIQTAMGRIHSGKVEVVSTSEVKEYQDIDQALVETDKALQELGPESEDVDQVVFGLKKNWIEQGEVVAEHKPLLKRITEELTLKPVGFVAVNEALVQHLIHQQKMLSAIGIYLQKKYITLFLIKKGKLIEAIEIGRSGKIIDDLKEGLARLRRSTQETQDKFFPNKILLISSNATLDEVKKEQQTIINHSWQEEYPFLQPPLVEIMPDEVFVSAVTQQAGRAVAKSKGIILKTQNTSVADDSEPAGIEANPQSDVVPVDEEQAEFARAMSFGVPIDDKFIPNNANSFSQDDTSEDDYAVPLKNPTAKPKISRFESNFVNSKAFGYFQSHKAMVITGIFSGLLALIPIGYFILLTTSTVVINLHLKSQQISQETQIVLDPGASQSDAENLILKADTIDHEFVGEDSAVTTGVKLVGEKATGLITIFNKTTSEKTFPAGTVFSYEDLTFELNDETTVPAAEVTESGDSETKKFGKIDAQITAQDIGVDSNLLKDISLQVESFDTSSYSASVQDDGLNGGSSREIQVVAVPDRKDLLDALSAKLIEDAREFYKNESKDGKYVIPLGSLENSTPVFNAEVGEETETLTLKLTANAPGIVYLTQDLKPLVETILASQIPSGYHLSDQEPDVMTSPSPDATDSSQIILEANISAKTIPDVNSEQLIDQLVSISPDEASAKLNQDERFSTAEILFKPGLAKMVFAKLPKSTSKFKVIFNND